MYVVTSYALIIGKARIVVCPHCNYEKEIMSIISGNTFNSEHWSDNKLISPMMPEVSDIQKCKKCGKYFIISRQKEKYADSESCEQGLLSFNEMKEAFLQIKSEGFLDIKEEGAVRMLLHQSYNDCFHRNKDKSNILKQDKELFTQNAIWLIDNYLTDDIMKAEFYREIEKFDEAQKILKDIVVDDDFLQKIVKSILERVYKNDSQVFLLKY